MMRRTSPGGAHFTMRQGPGPRINLAYDLARGDRIGLLVLAAMACILFSGCAGPSGAPGHTSAWPEAAEQPKWVEQPSTALPGAGFLTAVGVGPSRPDAEEAAVARLAQAVRVDVDAVESVRRTYERIAGVDAMDERERVEAHSEVRLDADVRLPGVQIAAVYHDPQRESVYALASLDRRRAGAALRSDRDAASRRARSALRRAESQESPLRRARLLRAAADHAYVAAQAEASWRAVAPAGDVAAADGDAATELLADIESRLTETLDDIVLHVEASADSPPALGSALRDAARSLGLPVSRRQPASAIVRLRYELDESSSYAPRQRLFAWRVEVEVIDAPRRRSLDALRLSGVVQAPSARAARSEALSAARRGLERDARAFLDGALFGPPASADIEH